MVHSLRSGPHCVLSIVIEVLGLVTCVVKTEEGVHWSGVLIS